MLKFLKKFSKNRNGSILPVTALLLFPMIIVIAGTIDFTYFLKYRSSIQNAADAAALATGRYLETNMDTDDIDKLKAELQEYGENFFLSNLPDEYDPQDHTFTITHEEGQPFANPPVPDKLNITVDYEYHAFFNEKIHNFNVTGTTTTEVSIGSLTVEIALVLDNSLSMKTNGRIDTLQTEGKKLVNAIYNSAALSTVKDPVKMSLVPFAGVVNVGTENKNASWMDIKGWAPNHHENFDWTTYVPTGQLEFVKVNGVNVGVRETINGKKQWLTRYNVFDMLGEDWAGCVEMRPWPHNVMDTAANTYNRYVNINSSMDADNDGKDDGAAALFVPYFAPDTPDQYYASHYSRASVATYAPHVYHIKDDNKYTNDYLYDFQDYDVQNPTMRIQRYTDQQNTIANHLYGLRGDKQIARTNIMAKYQRNNRYNGELEAGVLGPNERCNILPIQPLTTDKQQVLDTFDKMRSNLGHGTNVQQGLTWGWRTLSSGEPFTEGREKDDHQNLKAIILLTDGANFYQNDGNSSDNISSYGVWGFARASQSEPGKEYELNPLNGLPTHNRWMEGLEREDLKDTIYADKTFVLDNSDRATTHRDTFKDIMNAHTLQACNNVKKEGITIYTVAFQIIEDKTKEMIEACAGSGIKSDGTKIVQSGTFYFDASEGQLDKAFSKIAESIASLRVSG